MARCVLFLLLPILLSLSLLAEATRNNLLPENSEVKVDDSLILHDDSEQNPLIRLPSEKKEKENEMMLEVPQLVPKETDNRFSVAPRLKEGGTDFISSSPLIEIESDSSFLGGRKDLRFGRPGAGCRHRRRGHGGEMRFRHGFHRDGDHFRFHPQFLPIIFEDSPLHGEKPLSERRIFPDEFIPRANEESRFEPRERAFERIRKYFLEHAHGQDHREWEFPNGEEHKHGRHENHHEGEMKFEPQFPRPGDHGEEAFSRFPGEFFPRDENEERRFESRERAFEHNGGKPVFPDREHAHDHGRHGEWVWDFPNGEEQEHRRHGDHGEEHEHRRHGDHGEEHEHRRHGDGEEGFPRFPGKFFPRDENEEPQFEPRERAFEHHGGKPVFPDREHTHDHGRHGEGGWDFPNGEVHRHRRHGDLGEEGISSFPEDFFPRERGFEHNGGKPVFPDREHFHGHGHRGWGFPNGGEHKHWRHEHPPAPWTDWLRSLFGGH